MAAIAPGLCVGKFFAVKPGKTGFFKTLEAPAEGLEVDGRSPTARGLALLTAPSAAFISFYQKPCCKRFFLKA